MMKLEWGTLVRFLPEPSNVRRRESVSFEDRTNDEAVFEKRPRSVNAVRVVPVTSHHAEQLFRARSGASERRFQDFGYDDGIMQPECPVQSAQHMTLVTFDVYFDD